VFRVFKRLFFVTILILTFGGKDIAEAAGIPKIEEEILSITYTWPQEPNGFERTAKMTIPAGNPEEKFPVVFHLHGGGGEGNTNVMGNFLPECIQVAPDGYDRHWNIYFESSKADDVQFILDLIDKIAAEVPQANMSNVNIAGSSNGAAMIYQLLIDTDKERPFQRVFPMASSLISPQYHEEDNTFWTFSQASGDHQHNNFDTEIVPEFSDNFEYAHFHGTADEVCRYEGQDPGPPFIDHAKLYAAQLTDFVWAKAMGYVGDQINDVDGTPMGPSDKPAFEYKYLGGRCRHYKLVGEPHGFGHGNHPVVYQVIREMILGHDWKGD